MKKKMSKERRNIGLYCAFLISKCVDIDYDSDYAEGVRWAIENMLEYIKRDKNFKKR